MFNTLYFILYQPIRLCSEAREFIIGSHFELNMIPIPFLLSIHFVHSMIHKTIFAQVPDEKLISF